MQERKQDVSAAQRPGTVPRKPAALPRTEGLGPAAASATQAPGGHSPASVIALQRSVGNATVAHLLETQRHVHGASCGHQQTAPEEGPVQRRTAAHDVLGRPGRPLPEPELHDMQARFGGADFSDVRIHNDAAAKKSAQEIGARAYTSGSHIVIGEGGGDRHTLAHELTHVLQQRRGPVAGTDNGNGMKISDPSDRFEVAAEENARRVMSGSAPATGRTAQRAVDDAVDGTVTDTAAGAGPAHAVQRRKPSADAPKDHYAAKAQDHPEWAVFQKMMKAGGFPADVIESAWQLLLGGIAEQAVLNQKSSDPSIDSAERRKIRASNTWFRELVNLVGEHLRITTPTLALWSGGFDVSVYAHGKGHTSLEFTRLGKVVDQLELHADWKLQAPLWNVLSTAFVERATGPVHVFLRAYNPDSVLIAQEIPQLRMIQQLNPAVTLMWHPLYTTPDGKIKEISERLELTDNAEYKSRDKCVAVMYHYLLRFHDESNSKASMAHKEMNELLAQNVNPKATTA
ncbi:eCIS core domain-containing protein [Streptomyces sp. NBC_00448]|uniref:eCIS core domain-containing protein n=1 Tax=Streptomyces sp. NBC_00448 TaxID=2903652 RepID=UPI003FA7B68A